MTNFMYIFCLFAWGLNFIAVKIQGTPVSLKLSLTYRLLITAVLFIILGAFLRPKGIPQKKNVPFILIFGICNFMLSYLCLYYATILSSAAMVTLIFSLKVILTPIALRIFLKESFHPRILLGGLLGVAGVCIFLYPSMGDIHGLADLKGMMIAFLGTVITALGDAASARNAKKKINPLYANVIGFTVGGLLLGGVVIFQGQEISFPTSTSYWSGLLYLTIIASFGAWLFYLKLVERIGGAKSGYMVALFPAIAGFASVAIGESNPSIYLLIGCICSCLGAGIALGLGSYLSKVALKTNKSVNK
ncbi:DMT family transporter [Priestia megaterium]|uniref:DMT family transporter n=1 Tax=Priestia megaterium TaxID=1404 RepID=UPI0015E032A3|nr:DMT family transporter [Priestia megaterium]